MSVQISEILQIPLTILGSSGIHKTFQGFCTFPITVQGYLDYTNSLHHFNSYQIIWIVNESIYCSEIVQNSILNLFLNMSCLTYLIGLHLYTSISFE